MAIRKREVRWVEIGLPNGVGGNGIGGKVVHPDLLQARMGLPVMDSYPLAVATISKPLTSSVTMRSRSDVTNSSLFSS